MTEQKKVAIVTGASQGIGAAIAAAYRARGYRVVATSRSIEPSHDPDFLTIQGDIADPETARRIVALAVETYGRVDTLVNNAGIFVANAFTSYTPEDYAAATSTNLNGFFFPTQEALKVMETQGSGHIVSITTALVSHPLSQVPSTLASLTKGGIQASTRSLAIEYANRSIRVNAVAPGVIKTPMHEESTHAFLSALHPVGRMGEISEVVDAVLFLEDARFVTGEIIHVDGGQSAGH
jgi:NAD(P)-dependent dehydrogenase (short-subunit alcohol dehydrogenase family)